MPRAVYKVLTVGEWWDYCVFTSLLGEEGYIIHCLHQSSQWILQGNTLYCYIVILWNKLRGQSCNEPLQSPLTHAGELMYPNSQVVQCFSWILSMEVTC